MDSSNVVAEIHARLVGLELRGGVGWSPRGDDTRRAAQEDEGRALVRFTRVVLIGTDDDIRVAIAVDIASPGNAVAETR